MKATRLPILFTSIALLAACGGGGGGNGPAACTGDCTPPTLAVTFPPASAMTDTPLPGVVGFRGVVSDETELSGITVNGNPATYDPADGSWQADVSLVDGLNTVTVVAEDLAGNTTTVTREVTRVADSYAAGLTFGSGPAVGVISGAALDASGGRLLFTDHALLFALDFASGDWVEVANLSNALPGAGAIRDLQRIDESTLLLGTRGNESSIARHDLATGTTTRLQWHGDGVDDTGDAAWSFINALDIDNDGQRVFALVVTPSFNTLAWQFDLEAGTRARVGTLQWSSSSLDISRDISGNARSFVANCGGFHRLGDSGSLGSIQLSGDTSCAKKIARNPDYSEFLIYEKTGKRLFFLLPGDSIGGPVPGAADSGFGVALPPTRVGGMDVDWENRIAYLTENEVNNDVPNRIVAVDLETGYRVLLAIAN